MGAYPSKKTKEEVLDLLKSDGIDVVTINEFNALPEIIISNDISYKLSLLITTFEKTDYKYNYEFNYYSDAEAKYLFKYMICSTITDSIDYLTISINEHNTVVV